MGKKLFIAEKPSVAREFANALKVNTTSRDGYLESADVIVTWCVGHLVTMSYPDAYDERLRRWSFDTIPFLPEEYKYEVIESSKKQYTIVSSLMKRPDVTTIYVCTDSGREGEYIYRLVEQMSGVKDKERRRVWIDSQTEEEILRGIREAKDLKEYDNLSDAAYLRAKEDYLMGINFSRVLTLKYGNAVKDYLKRDKAVISVGRVMTCVLGIIVNREREIRSFVKTPFYRVLGSFRLQDRCFTGEWKAVEGSAWFASPKLYKENGFKEKADAEKLVAHLEQEPVGQVILESIARKKENKNPPLLYNLAELQNDCSKMFKISPDETLRIVQELYEKKMVTYPRTDARVLSTAVAKEIHKNIGGLQGHAPVAAFAAEILQKGSHKGIAKTRYVNDKQITDHYAIIPTGQGIGALNTLNQRAVNVYEAIVRRFLAVFYPAASYRRISLTAGVTDLPGGERTYTEQFFAGWKALLDPGYLKVMQYSFQKKKNAEAQENVCNEALLNHISGLKKKDPLTVAGYEIKEGETSPPKRYNSGSMILAMENAGQLIEDEELRAQIKGSGIGTSATRAEILKKLVANKHLALNKKTQTLTPTLLGEMIYDVVNASIKSLLNPELTASWEKGLTYVAEGSITTEEYMVKLTKFIESRTNGVLNLHNQSALREHFDRAAQYYKKEKETEKK